MTTPQQSYDNIIGALPFDWEWWESYLLNQDKGSGEWEAYGRVYDPEDDGESVAYKTIRFSIDHEKVMAACEKIWNEWPQKWSEELARNCIALINAPDECDFDSAQADAVLQVALFGKEIFA